MAYADRVKETTSTTGNGDFALSGAATGFRTFASAHTVGASVAYCAEGGSEWEVGIGTLSSSTTLARTTVLASSNGGALVSFSAGTKNLFETIPASQLVTTADGVGVAQLPSIPSGNASNTFRVLGYDAGGTLSVMTVAVMQTIPGFSSGASSPTETITVNTPASQTAGTAFSVTGTYANGTPTALDYSLDSGSTWVAATATISSGTYTITGVTVASANASQTVKVRDRNASTVIGTSAAFAVSSGASQTISVTTPSAQTAGTAFTLAGTYANGTPTALDYSLDGGTTWTAAASPTISGGNYSFSLTIASANASQTVKVRDHTTNVTGTSGTFAVNAAGQTNAQKYNNVAFASFSLPSNPYSFTGGSAPNQYFSQDFKVQVLAADNTYPAATALKFFWIRVASGAAAPTSVPSKMQATGGVWPTAVPYNVNGGTGNDTVTVPSSVATSGYFNQTSYPGIFNGLSSLYGGGASGDYYLVVGFPDGSSAIVPTKVVLS